MPRTLLGLLLVAAMGLAQTAAARTVIVVRHAEKQSDTDKDPDLSILGQDRALKLTSLLKAVAVDAIFATTLKRTQQTAQPLAKLRGRTIVTLDPKDTAGLAAAVQKLSPAATAVVVGHSNTVPEILLALGVKAPVTIGDAEYGRVFVVVQPDAGAPTLVELQY